MFTFNNFQNAYFNDSAVSESQEQTFLSLGFQVKRYDTSDYDGDCGREICNVKIPDQIRVRKLVGKDLGYSQFEDICYVRNSQYFIDWRCDGDHWYSLRIRPIRTR